jgi:hypothetical protein
LVRVSSTWQHSFHLTILTQCTDRKGVVDPGPLGSGSVCVLGSVSCLDPDHEIFLVCLTCLWAYADDFSSSLGKNFLFGELLVNKK